jgi:hypothetical protein
MKPQDLLIGLRDILSLLVPGAILLLFLPIDVIAWLSGRITFGPDNKIDTTLLLFIFLIAAMATGALLSGLAGQADELVDAFVEKRIKEPADRPLFKNLARRIKSLGRVRERAAQAEAELVQRLPGGQPDALAWSTRSFWWNYLRLNCPVAIAELDRAEGLQKQFRSLALVGVLIAGFAPYSGSPWPQAVIGLVVGLFCLASYVGHRIKFSRRLFELALIFTLSKMPTERG